MTDKKRPPRFEDIIALSKPFPPRRTAVVSPFSDITTNPLDRPKDEPPGPRNPAWLQQVTPADFPALPPVEPPDPEPVENPPELGTQSTQLGTQTMGSAGTQSTQSTQSSLGTQEANQELVLTPPKAAVPVKWKDNREQLNLKISPDLTDRLRRYAFDNRMTVTDAMVTAIKLLLGTHTTLGTQTIRVPNLPAYLIDDIDDDEGPTIELYENLTGNTFTVEDQMLLREHVKTFGHDCVRCAMLLGKSRYGGKPINKFKFFEKNIREVAAWQPEKIARELEFLKTQRRRIMRR